MKDPQIRHMPRYAKYATKRCKICFGKVENGSHVGAAAEANSGHEVRL